MGSAADGGGFRLDRGLEGDLQGAGTQVPDDLTAANLSCQPRAYEPYGGVPHVDATGLFTRRTNAQRAAVEAMDDRTLVFDGGRDRALGGPRVELVDTSREGDASERGDAKQFAESFGKTCEAFGEWLTLRVTTMAVDAIAPGLGRVVDVAFKICQLVRDVRAASSESPGVVVPLPDFVPGLGVDVEISLGDAKGRGTVVAFVSPDMPSFICGWGVEEGEETERGEGSEDRHFDQTPRARGAALDDAQSQRRQKISADASPASPSANDLSSCRAKRRIGYVIEVDLDPLRWPTIDDVLPGEWLAVRAAEYAPQLSDIRLDGDVDVVILADRSSSRAVLITLAADIQPGQDIYWKVLEVRRTSVDAL
jgi:hypothetical protein